MSSRHFTKRAWVEINLAQLKRNYEAYRAEISGADIMAVVKADAYGHGAIRVARCLESMGVTLFAVSNIDEAIELRLAGIQGELVVLGYTPIDRLDAAHQYNVTQTLVSEEYARAACAVSLPVHYQFAIDTGMNRIGIDGKDPEKAAAIIRAYGKRLSINGIFTHLCTADGAEASDRHYTELQTRRFAAVAEALSDLKLPYVHCLNSAGGLYHPETPAPINGIVRLGVLLYGLMPNYHNPIPDTICPILTWKSVISMVKTVQKGESIGYGRSFTAPDTMKIATVPVGYADGYNRLLSNRFYMLTHGQKASIVGRICMDQCMIDVSHIPDVAIGDEVILLGEDNGETITADSMANALGTIGYEIVCNISKRVPRLYI